jgi:hypothetical protein
MKRFALAPLLVLIASCSHMPPRPLPVSPPRASVAIAPSVDRVRTDVDHARDTSILVNAGLENAVKEVERLAVQKTASEKELKNLSSILKDEQERSGELYSNLSQASITIDDLAKKAEAKDLENVELRDSLKAANERIIDADKWQQDNVKKVAVYDWISSRLMWLLVAVIFVASIYGLFRFLPIIIRIFKPF